MQPQRRVFQLVQQPAALRERPVTGGAVTGILDDPGQFDHARQRHRVGHIGRGDDADIGQARIQHRQLVIAQLPGVIGLEGDRATAGLRHGIDKDLSALCPQEMRSWKNAGHPQGQRILGQRRPGRGERGQRARQKSYHR